MSHETIYAWIWKDKQQGGSLWQCLRGARKRRRKRYGRYDSRGRLAGKKMIAERPAVVEERSRLGDWEIDTVHGSGKACVLTLVDRKSRLVRIGNLARATALLASSKTIELLGTELGRLHSITGDNGSEFHSYKLIEQSLGLPFYFATPHHAWERGTNENTNGLLRQYLPKRTNLSAISQSQCSRIAEHLNSRPRKSLNFMTPNEVYYSIPVPSFSQSNPQFNKGREQAPSP